MFDDNFFDLILDGPFTWDKNAYRFNRTEKDMHPYSVVNGKETLVIVHNVLGVDKKDLKLTIKNENAILKFLEEPLKNAFIVLLSENIFVDSENEGYSDDNGVLYDKNAR